MTNIALVLIRLPTLTCTKKNKKTKTLIYLIYSFISYPNYCMHDYMDFKRIHHVRTEVNAVHVH